MKTFNTVTLLGYVTSNIQEIPTNNDTRAVSLVLKTRDFHGKGSDKKVTNSYHNLIFWNSLSDNVISLLKKDDVIMVHGRLKSHKVDLPNDGVYYRTEVVVTDWTKVFENNQLQSEEPL